MLSTDDIKKLTDYQKEAFKDIFASKGDFERLEGKVSILQTSVDAIAKDNQIKNQETPVLNRRIKEVENWVDKAAPKLGIKFTH